MGTMTFWIWSSEKWQFGFNHWNPVLETEFLCLKAGVFLVTAMKCRISGQRYKHLTRFSRFVLFEPAASTMQKINPVDCFNLCHWRFVYIHLFPVIWRKSSRSDFQSWRHNFSNDFALFSWNDCLLGDSWEWPKCHSYQSGNCRK